MPFALIIIGMILLVSAYKGTQKDLFDLLKSDFTGPNNFFFWVLAVVFIIALGNIRAIKPVTDAFLGLVILVIIIAQYRGGRDLFASFIEQVRDGTAGVSRQSVVDSNGSIVKGVENVIGGKPVLAEVGTYAKQVGGKWVSKLTSGI